MQGTELLENSMYLILWNNASQGDLGLFRMTLFQRGDHSS